MILIFPRLGINHPDCQQKIALIKQKTIVFANIIGVRMLAKNKVLK